MKLSRPKFTELRHLQRQWPITFTGRLCSVHVGPAAKPTSPLNCALNSHKYRHSYHFFFFSSKHSGSYQVLRQNADSCDSIDKMVQSDDTSAESACLTRRGGGGGGWEQVAGRSCHHRYALTERYMFFLLRKLQNGDSSVGGRCALKTPSH